MNDIIIMFKVKNDEFCESLQADLSVKTWQDLMFKLDNNLYNKVQTIFRGEVDNRLYFNFRAEVERNIWSELEK